MAALKGPPYFSGFALKCVPSLEVHMRDRFVLVVMLLLVAAVPAVAQSQMKHAPRTPPDLQGFWTNATFTPFERPKDFAGKEYFTPEEAAAFEQKRLKDE